MATRRKKYSYWSRGDDWKSPEQLAAEEAQGGISTFAEPTPLEVTPPTEEPVAPSAPDDFLTRVGKTAIGFGDVVTSGIESKFTNSELAGTRRGMAMDEEQQALATAASKLKTALGGLLPGPAATALQLSALDDMRQVNRAKEVQSDEEGTQALLDKLITARAEQKERSARGYAAIDASGDPARLTRAVAAVASQPEQALPLLAGAGATAVGGPLAGYAASAATAPLPAVVVYDASYNDAVDAGLSDKDADSFAKWMSTSEYALEAFTGGIAGSFGKTVLKSAIKQWAKQTGKMALVEGVSEAATGTLQDAGNLALSQSDGKLGDYAGGQLPKSLGDFVLRRYDEGLAGAIGGGAITAATNYVEARTDSATARLAENVRLAADVSAAPPNIVAAAAKGVERATQLTLPGFGEQQKVEPVEPLPQVETQVKAEQTRTEDQLKIKAGVLQQQATEASAFADAKDAKVQEALQFDLPVNQGDVVQGTEARAVAEQRAKEADVLKLGVAATEQPLPLTGGEMGKKNFEDVVVGGKPYVRNKLTGELTDRRAQRIEEAKVAQGLKDQETLVSKTKSRETARKKYETTMIKQAADLGKDVTYVDQKLKQWDTNNALPKVETIAAERVAAAVKKDAVVPKGSKPKVVKPKTEDATAAMDKLAGVVAAPPANLESVPQSTADGTKLEAPADDAKLDKLSGALVRGLGVKKSDQLGAALKKGNVKIVRHASQLPDWSGSKTEGVYNAKDGSVYLVASELTEATAAPTILHEVAHKLRGEADGKKYDTAVTQMLGDKGAAKAVRDVEAAANRGSTIAQRAVKRAAAARDRANGNETVYAEEIIGYAVTQAELARQNKSPFGLGSVIRDIAQELNISYSKAFGSEITLTPEIIAKLNRRKFSDTISSTPTKAGTTQSESVIGPKSSRFIEEAIERPEDVYEGAKDKKRRIEISDYEATVKPGAGAYLAKMGSMKLGSYMNHPKLFDGYDTSIDRVYENTLFTDGSRDDFTITYGPMKDIMIRVEDINTNAYYDPNSDEIIVSKESLSTPNEMREWVAHEIQHAIQTREGFVSGTDLFTLMSEEAKKVGAETVLSKRPDGGTHVTFAGVTKEKASEIFEKSWNKYDRNYGEAEARVTQINWKMTPEEMREALPEDRMTSQEDGVPLKREQLESVYEAPESEAFKKWFGNSKIVDANGNPLKLYHGAPLGKFGFDTFMRNSLGLIFVSTEKKFANIFAGIQEDDLMGVGIREAGGVYELYVRAEKPFDYENSDDIERLTDGNNSVLLRAYDNVWGFNPDYTDKEKVERVARQLKNGDWTYYETPSIVEWMEDNGYDAMYLKEALAKNLAVFDPNQLKSANANQGSFRLDSNNIYESVVDETDDSGTKQAVRGIGRLLGIDKLLAPTMLNRIVDHPGGYTAHIAVLADTQAALWKEAEARAAKKKGVKPKVIRQEIDKRIAAIDKLTDANARASALLALDRDYPGVGKAVAKMRDLKWGLSRMAYSLRRRDPKPLTSKEVSIYKKMFENAETYNTRAYQATFGLKSEKYGKEFLKRANKNPQSEEGVKLKAAIDYLVANNLLIPDATTLSNMKKPQLRRMYETWSNRAPGKMKRATMIAELGKIVVPNRTVLEAKALRIVEEMLGQTKMLGPVAKQFVGQKLDRTILEARKEVPKVLRDVMGEITDPYVKELLSIARLTQLVARTKMLNELAEQGKDTLWTEEKGENTKFQVNGEAFGPLDGKWVNADVQQLLRDQLTMTTSIEDAISGAQREPEQLVGKAVALGIKGATKIAGWWKLTNVVFSPQNFGANLVGSPAMALMNGAYSPTTWVSSFYKTAKALASAEFPGNEKGGDYAAEYLYANVLDSATIGEFRGQVYDNIFSEIAKLDNKDPNFFVNGVKTIWGMIGTGVASAREGYALMDVWAKVASYEVRKEQLADYYKAMGVTKSAKEISREAGYDVSLSNISYNRAPPIIKMIERTVPFAAFLTYFSEVFRSVGGSLYLAAQDAQRAAQAVSAGNPKAAAIMGTAAVKRLSGTVAATGGVIALTNYMLDSEDEEEKRRRLLDPDWETNNPRVVLGQDANGNDITLGLNRFDPLGPMNEAIVAVMRAKDGEQWDQIGTEIEGLLVKNKGAMQFYKTIWDAALKSADSVAPNLYKEILGRTEYKDLSENTQALLWQYVPAPAKSLSPDYPVIASNKPEDMRALGDTLTGIGAKLYVRDPEKSIRFRVWDFKGTTDAIRKDYRSFLDGFDGTSEELYSAVEEFAQREQKAVDDLAAAYDGYQAYGKTSRDFLAILKAEKVDGNTVKGLLQGEYRSGIFSGQDLDRMFKTRAATLDKKAPDYKEQLQALREEKAMFREAYLRLRESEQ